MFYIISCTYIDTDGSENTDPTAGIFSSEMEAIAFLSELKSQPAITGAWLSETDEPL